FWWAYAEKARPFTPDMVVVNYIELDFPRTQPHDGMYYLPEREQQIKQAVEVFNEFLAARPHVVFTLMPLLEDLTATPDYSRTQAVLKQVPAARHVVMAERMKSIGGSGPNVDYRNWYNWPKAFDGHMSDDGNDIYARTMAITLGEDLAANLTHQSFDKAAVTAEVMQTTPDPAPESSSRGMRVLENPAYVARLRETIANESIRARIPLIRSAVLDRLPKRPSNPFMRDPSLPVAVVGHVPVRYGPGEGDVALLNMAC